MSVKVAYHRQAEVFSESTLEAVKSEILGSKYLGKSPLGPEFVKTQGFSIVFQRPAFERVTALFPAFESVFERLLFGSCNAFYINPLVMAEQSRVEPHIDCRSLPERGCRIIPNLVSVFYVQAEGLSGGELVLGSGRDDCVAITPASNELLVFPGALIHHVEALTGHGQRISLVCEQYHLDAELLSAFPEFMVLRDKDLAPRVSLS